MTSVSSGVCVGRVPSVTLILMFFGVGGVLGWLVSPGCFRVPIFFCGVGFSLVDEVRVFGITLPAVNSLGWYSKQRCNDPPCLAISALKKMTVWGVLGAISLPTHGEGAHLSSLGVGLPFS